MKIMSYTEFGSRYVVFFLMVYRTWFKIDKTVCKKMKVMEEFSEAHQLMTVKKMLLTGKELKDLVSFILCIFWNLLA